MEINEEQPLDLECNLLENNSIENIDTNSEGSSLDKFKNSDELLKAYQMLEKEFTKKCQKIKELEAFNDNENKSPTTVDNEGVSPENAKTISNISAEKTSIKDLLIKTFSVKNNHSEGVENNSHVEEVYNKNELKNNQLDGDSLKEFIFSNEDIRNKFIENYLNEIQSQKTAPLMVNTANSNFCISPKQKPKNIKDAGEYAKEILNN